VKINRIASSGFLAVKSIEADVRSPIVLFCGKNEAGKSSLRDGIYQAFTGENPRVRLKKEYKFLVNDTGTDPIGYTYVDYNTDHKACIILPNGTHELSAPLCTLPCPMSLTRHYSLASHRMSAASYFLILAICAAMARKLSKSCLIAAATPGR